MSSKVKVRDDRRVSGISLILLILRRLGGPRRTTLTGQTVAFLAGAIATMDLLLLFRISVRTMQFVKEAAGVAQRRLAIGTFAP
jgi:hypothetical protein